ncbi:hypothetical protein OHC33_002468 [Knufia fluminis]|uniref:Uncharacterized protein n=1 Tax=Knufia fluminis TaxID=191047 RepID=A0AAN8EJD5_9EURO|nr:hypothetical protein OHC33_002468 [Knufia fluminis]
MQGLAETITHGQPSKNRTHNTRTIFDISPEIGHAFVAPIHEALFEQYKTYQSQYFPFVPLSTDLSSGTIMEERPFLYTCCVMTASHRDPALQSRIARDVLKYLSEHMILAGEKDLDLLQGLLVMTAWYHMYINSNPQLMNLLHLAQALAVDLGLNQAPGPWGLSIKAAPDATFKIHGNEAEPPKLNLENCRVRLGLYHVHARYSVAFRRLDPPTWTDWLEECCRVLEEAVQYQSDAYAVALVRLDHITERYTGPSGFKPGSSMPVQAYVKLFSDDIHRLGLNMPDHLRTWPLMLADIQAAEMHLFESVIGAACDVPVHRVEAYHACLKKVLAYLDTFTSQDIAQVPYQPFLSTVSLAHAFDIVSRLSFAQAEGWDLTYVRSTPGFNTLSDRMYTMLKSVQEREESMYPTSRSIRFKVFCLRLEKFKQWYNAKVQQERSSQQSRDKEDVVDNWPPSDGLSSLPVMADFSDLLWQDYTIDWSKLDSDFNFA